MTVLPFDFNGSAIRVIPMDGQEWFVAKDVCDVLGTQTRDVRRMLDKDEVETLHIAPGKGGRPAVLISESGLYQLVFRSRKAAAKRFRRWVTSEVIPAIRRTGKYAVSDPLAELTAVPRETIAGFLKDQDPLSMSETFAFGALVRQLNQALGVAYEFDHDPAFGKVRTYSEEILHQAWFQFQRRRSPFTQLEFRLEDGGQEEAA